MGWVQWDEGVALTTGRIDRVGAYVPIDTTRLIDLLDALCAEVDRDGLTVFFCAHLEPGMGIFSDTIGELTDGFSR